VGEPGLGRQRRERGDPLSLQLARMRIYVGHSRLRLGRRRPEDPEDDPLVMESPEVLDTASRIRVKAAL